MREPTDLFLAARLVALLCLLCVAEHGQTTSDLAYVFGSQRLAEVLCKRLHKVSVQRVRLVARDDSAHDFLRESVQVGLGPWLGIE